ncbi:hypothetical protein QFZ40_004028 [Arthrobacter pascens]|uniref:chain-length determining protein n=1 Tax=Arthrobacter pascens TaxID=1677 RepID=UPI0027844446|nr:chain-length determining protein [Arthrobacter pascens]MDQ0636119.1 hypothetical protein [Arthrobacter pascens]
MDPLSVIRILKQHKWVALPAVLLTLFAVIYVLLFAPRSYQATMTYALVTPKLPSATEILANPTLATANGDNPYLRSPDSSLLSQVLITKLGGQATSDDLREEGLGTEYTVSQASNIGSGMLLQLQASGSSPDQAVATVRGLAQQLTSTLYDLQKVNGADDGYLFSALPVDGPGQAKENFSSRLRTLIIVGVAGAFLAFGAVSIARSIELSRGRRFEAGDVSARHAKTNPKPGRGSNMQAASKDDEQAHESRSEALLSPPASSNIRSSMVSTLRD